MEKIRIGRKVITENKYVEYGYMNLTQAPPLSSLLEFCYIGEGILESGGEYSFNHRGPIQNISLEFSTGGELTLHRKKRVRQIRKEDVFVETPNYDSLKYTFRNPGPFPVRRYVIVIQLNSYYQQLFQLYDLDIVYNVNMEKLLECTTSLLQKLKTQKECSPEELSVDLFEILTFLTSSSLEKNALAGTKKQKLTTVKIFPQRFPTLTSLLDYFQVSRETLYHIFHEYTHDAPMDFVIKSKLINSCWMLKDTQYPVSEIARLAGYNTLSFYSSAFKKLVGISPTQYRKKYSQLGKNPPSEFHPLPENKKRS